MLRAGLLLLLCIAAAGCNKSPIEDAGRPLQVRVAYAAQPDCALIHVALLKGFFREEGVEVVPVLRSFGKQALDSVLEGKADLATVAETPLMFAALRGEKVAVVASIFTSEKNHAIVASRKGGVAREGDLRGKRIGFTPGTTSDIFLHAFLTANGIAQDEVVPVGLKPDEMLDAMMSGRVHAISTWNPIMKIVARQLGKDGSLFSDPYIFTEIFVLAGRPTYVEENPGGVRRVLRALLKAEAFAAQHPAEAQALVAGSLRVAPDLLQDIWSEGSFRISLDHDLLITLEEETRWALKHGKAPHAQMPNYLELIDSRPLKAVKPEAVSVKGDHQ